MSFNPGSDDEQPENPPSNSASDGEERAPIFVEAAFYIHNSVNKDVDALRECIQMHGGEILDDMLTPTSRSWIVVIADEQRVGSLEALRDAMLFDRRYEHLLLGAGKKHFMVHRAAYVMKCVARKDFALPVLRQPKGRVSGGKLRNDFTASDDENLIQYMVIKFPDGSKKGRQSHHLFEHLAQMPKFSANYTWAARHTANSWRERYRKNLEYFDERIEELQQGYEEQRGEIGLQDAGRWSRVKGVSELSDNESDNQSELVENSEQAHENHRRVRSRERGQQPRASPARTHVHRVPHTRKRQRSSHGASTQPRKRARTDYADEHDDWEEPRQPPDRRPHMPPTSYQSGSQTNVGREEEEEEEEEEETGLNGKGHSQEGEWQDTSNTQSNGTPPGLLQEIYDSANGDSYEAEEEDVSLSIGPEQSEKESTQPIGPPGDRTKSLPSQRQKDSSKRPESGRGRVHDKMAPASKPSGDKNTQQKDTSQHPPAKLKRHPPTTPSVRSYRNMSSDTTPRNPEGSTNVQETSMEPLTEIHEEPQDEPITAGTTNTVDEDDVQDLLMHNEPETVPIDDDAERDSELELDEGDSLLQDELSRIPIPARERSSSLSSWEQPPSKKSDHPIQISDEGRESEEEDNEQVSGTLTQPQQQSIQQSVPLTAHALMMNAGLTTEEKVKQRLERRKSRLSTRISIISTTSNNPNRVMQQPQVTPQRMRYLDGFNRLQSLTPADTQAYLPHPRYSSQSDSHSEISEHSESSIGNRGTFPAPGTKAGRFVVRDEGSPFKPLPGTRAARFSL